MLKLKLNKIKIDINNKEGFSFDQLVAKEAGEFVKDLNELQSLEELLVKTKKALKKAKTKKAKK